tara:strand:+ start:242 stop:667 length:426 start_codon:yes stop_codon:yes gene_type:complete
MTEQQQQQPQLKTNHNIRIVTLANGDHVLCMFGDVRNEKEDNKVVGYRMLYPYKLDLGVENEDGTIPIQYTRWCPFSPVEEHRLGGEHIISVVFPDNNIIDNFANRLKEMGLKEEQIFVQPKEEVTEAPDGDNSEPNQAAE